MEAKRKVIVYMISDINKALSFEWIAIHLKNKIDLNFVLLGKPKSLLSVFLKANSIPFYDVKLVNNRIFVWFKILKILYQLKPDIVHTHLWQANLLGLSAAWVLRIPKRIFTRHHATVHYREHPSGRKWDRLCNVIATDIIAISKNIEDILIRMDRADAKKVNLLHHGFDFDYFSKVSETQVYALRRKYKLEKQTGPVIGVISRYMEWKGVQYIIPAFQKLKEQFPDAKLILANAHGDYEERIHELLQALPVDSFIEIRFEEDLAALYHLYDVFVHVPVDPHVEAFGQTYIEALISKIPSVFTLSGIAREFVTHQQNGWVVDFKSSDQIAQGIIEILTNMQLRERLIRNGETSVQQFSLDRHILALEKIYT